MSDDKVRHYNPVTLLTELATPAYAAQVGLVRWDGETDEVEIDKLMIERAVLPDPEPEAKADSSAKTLHGNSAVGESKKNDSPKEG